MATVKKMVKKACKGVSYPKSSSVSKRIGSPSKAKSGGSFPDLNKDGKVTKKDILIGKGVLPKTAKKGMKVKKAFLGLENIFGGGRDRDTMKNKPTIKIKVKGRNNTLGDMSGLGGGQGMKKGGTVKKKMKTGGKTKKCMYGCK
jgi:hypothetical protein